MIVDGFDTDQLQRQYPPATQPNDASIFKSPVLMTGLLVAFSAFTLALVGALMMMQQRQQPTALSPPLQAQAEVQQAQAALDQTSYQVIENATRTDLNPVIASNPGILQKLLLNSATAFSQRVVTEKEKTSGHESEIVQAMIARAAQKLSLASAGQKAEIKYTRADGKVVVEAIYPDQLAAIAQLDLIVSKYQSRPTQQRFDITEVARESIANEKIWKCRKTQLLSIQGLSEVAKTLATTDIFGRTVDPSDQSNICPVSSGGVQ